MPSFFANLLKPFVAEQVPPAEALPVDGYLPENVDAMAGEMTEQQGVWWATKSCEMVEDKLSPEDCAAAEAAEAWVKNPCEETQQAAAEAAAATDFQGPGAWAAQAASWAMVGSQAAGMGLALAGASPAAAAATTMTPYGVAGAVKLAAAMSVDQPDLPEVPDPSGVPDMTIPELPGVPPSTAPDLPDIPDPAEQQEAAKALKPFIDLGHEIMEADQPWMDM